MGYGLNVFPIVYRVFVGRKAKVGSRSQPELRSHEAEEVKRLMSFFNSAVENYGDVEVDGHALEP